MLIGKPQGWKISDDISYTKLRSVSVMRCELQVESKQTSNKIFLFFIFKKWMRCNEDDFSCEFGLLTLCVTLTECKFPPSSSKTTQGQRWDHCQNGSTTLFG